MRQLLSRDLFNFCLMIMTLVSLFLSLPEEKEMTEHVHAEATPEVTPKELLTLKS
jgi:hypothetical protein